MSMGRLQSSTAAISFLYRAKLYPLNNGYLLDSSVWSFREVVHVAILKPRHVSGSLSQLEFQSHHGPQTG